MAGKHQESLVATDVSGRSVAAVAQAAREAMESELSLHSVKAVLFGHPAHEIVNTQST